MKLKIEYINIDDIKPYPNNAKLHPAEQVEQIKESIKEFGFNDPIAIDKNNEIIEGHGRYIACQELGIKEIPVIKLDNLTDEQKRAYMLVHNKLTMNSDFDIEILSDELDQIFNIDMSKFDFEIKDFDFEIEKKENETLAEKFIIPPFSVLDTRQGYWQNRKREWKEFGIDSIKGRDENINKAEDAPNYFKTGYKRVVSGTSVFDPVLCEICYRWFNIDNGSVFDPFAGGSVRGIVATKLGYQYIGIDLSEEQIKANNKEAEKLMQKPIWKCDDSLNADKYIEDNTCDMIFSCPPYLDLEKYSEDPRDLSNMDYETFFETYKKIIDIACRKLKENRFAVFVVGDVRDKRGAYLNFIDYTKKAFNDNGLVTYNEAILIEQFGTGALRANKTFASRKLVKTHQNVLIFYKGDIKEIKNNYKDIDTELLEENLIFD